MFIDCVNYYHDVLPSHAHILKPLMDQSGLTTYFMDRHNTKVFVKCVCLWLQEHSKWLGIHTNASDFQLGTCINQEGRPIAYFSCKLMMSQQNYTKMKNEYFPS
jgi:hypothetical protein